MKQTDLILKNGVIYTMAREGHRLNNIFSTKRF